MADLENCIVACVTEFRQVSKVREIKSMRCEIGRMKRDVFSTVL